MGLYIQARYEGTDYILYPSEDQPVLLDISSIDNGEIGELLGDLSQDFQIPATEEHNRFFQHAFNVGHQDIPGVYNSVEVSLNNEEQTLFLGSMVLNKWDKEEGIYTCAIESSIINLKDRLDEKLLSLAPGWDAYDHNYNMSEWVNSNTVQETGYDALDYYYPFIDFGYDEDGRARFESPEEVRVGGRPTQTSYVYQSQTTPGQANDLFGNTIAAVDARALYYPYLDGDLAATENIITSSPWFGEISRSNQPLEGFISHPSTPLRIEQLKPAIKLSTCLDMVFEVANLDDDGVPLTENLITYEAPFLDKQKDVFVLPNFLGKEGVIGSVGNVDDGFILTQVNVSDVNIDKGSSATTDVEDILQYTFGDAAVTRDFGNTDNLDGGAYIVPNPGTYEIEFSGELTPTSTNLLNKQFVANQAVLFVDGVIQHREGLERIDQDTPSSNIPKREWSFTWTGNLKVGQRVTVGLISNEHRGNRDVFATFRNWVFRSNQVAKDWTQTTVKLGVQFEETTALEFLKGVVQKQNIVVYKDKKRRNHYILRQYNDWILGGSLIEWSDRVGPLVQSNLLLEQPKELLFADAESDDRFNKIAIDSSLGLTYGAQEYVSNDTGITDGDKDIGDFFAPTIPGTMNYANDFQKSSLATAGGIPQLYEFEDGEKKIVDTGIHIGYSYCTASPGKFYYQLEDRSISYNGVVRTFSNLNEDRSRNLNWANGLYDNQAQSAYDLYWSQYINHLYTNNNVKVSTTVLLSPSEYQDLNINDTVHIDGNDYLINKISGFNLSEPAEVEVELISYKNNFTNVYEDPTIRYVEPVDADTRTAILGIKVVALDDDGEPWDIPVLQQSMYQMRLDGIAGSSVTETLVIRHIEGLRFDLSGSNFVGVNVPDGVTVGVGVDVGGDVHIPITVVIQPQHTFDYLEIQGEVDQLVDGDQTVNLNVSLQTGVTGVTINNPIISKFGQIGDTATFRVFMSADSNAQQILVSTIQTNASSVGDLTFVTATDFGTGAELVFTALIKETEAAGTYNVVVTQATVGNIDPGTSTVTHTINFIEPGYDNVSIYPTTITYTGEPNETHDFILNVAPSSGHRVSAPSWGITDVANIANDVPPGKQDGYNGAIVIVLHTPSTTITDPTNVTVNGADAFPIGAETRINKILIDAPGDTYTFQGFSDQDNALQVEIENVPGAKGIFQLDVTPDELYTFLDANTLGFGTDGVGLTYVGASLVGGSILANFEYVIGDFDTEARITHNNSSATAEENSIKFIFNNIGLDGATISRGELNVGYTGNAGDTIVDPDTGNNYVISVTAKTGMFPADNPDGTVNANISISIDNTAETLLIPDSDPPTYVEYEPGNERVESGVFMFDLVGAFPKFGGHHVVTFDISGTPVLRDATMGAFSSHLFTLPFGVPTIPSVSFTSNGNVQFVASGSSGSVTSVTDGWLPSPNHMHTNNEGGRVYAAFPLQAREGRSAYWLMFGGDGRANEDILDYIEIREEAESSNAAVSAFQTTSVSVHGGSSGSVFQYIDYTGGSTAILANALETKQICAVINTSISADVTVLTDNGGSPGSATTGTADCSVAGAGDGGGSYADNSGSTNGMTFHFVANGGTPTTIPMGNIYFEYE